MILKNILVAIYLSLSVALVHTFEDQIFPTADFRTAKNVAFATLGGGRSHHIWVFEILKEMYERGHNVSFYSTSDHFRFTKGFPMIKSSEIGDYGNIMTAPNVIEAVESNPRDHSILLVAVLEAVMQNYTSQFSKLQEYFERDEIDLVICDALVVACADAGMLANKPVVLTFTIGMFSDYAASYINNKLYESSHPTTETQSIWTRAYNAFIKYPYYRRRMARNMKAAHDLQRKLGLTPTIDTTDERYRDVLKLINNVYGIELARPAPPMFQMVGPVMRESYPPLDDETRSYLDERSRVCYIGFGQFALASPLHAEFILKALLTLKQEGHIDGIIWGRFDTNQLPFTIQVGNVTWTKDDILSNPDIRFMDWAPQFGILQHPSTSFFISHGGAGSLHEAMYNNVRIFVFPFFGDQPGNARSVERTGIARFVDKDELQFDEAGYEYFYKKLYEVAVDPNGEIQTNANRFGAYVQLNADKAVARSADLLEESIFASNEKGVLYHRRSVGYDIHWIKRHNLDIFALAVGIVSGLSMLSYFIYSSLEKKDLKLKQA